jgi:hypothetical protein
VLGSHLTEARFLLGTTIAALLATAGFLKLMQPEPSAIALARLGWKRVGRYVVDAADRVRVARLIGAAELTLAAALVWTGGRWHVAASWFAVGITAGFLGVTRRAVRLGVACGCWGSLSDGVTGPAEARRRVVLLLAAAANAVVATIDRDATNWFLAVIASLVIGAAVVLAVNPRLGRLVRLNNFATRTRDQPAVTAPVPVRQRRHVIGTIRRDPTVAESLRRVGLTDAAWRRMRVFRGLGPGAIGTMARLEHGGMALRVLLGVDGQVLSSIATMDRQVAVAHRDGPRAQVAESEV